MILSIDRSIVLGSVFERLQVIEEDPHAIKLETIDTSLIELRSFLPQGAEYMEGEDHVAMASSYAKKKKMISLDVYVAMTLLKHPYIKSIMNNNVFIDFPGTIFLNSQGMRCIVSLVNPSFRNGECTYVVRCLKNEWSELEVSALYPQ